MDNCKVSCKCGYETDLPQGIAEQAARMHNMCEGHEAVIIRRDGSKVGLPHYGKHQPEIELLLREIGNILKTAMPEGWGFALQIFEYGEGGSLLYTASADRQGVVGVLRELADKLEKAQ